MFLLISQPIKHLNSLDRSFIFTESIAFWYMISKKCHNHSVIIHIWGLWRCKTVKICKIHWKLRSKQRPVLFCKFLHKKRLDLCEIIFGGQLLSCLLKFKVSWRSFTNVCTRVINADTCDKTCVFVFTTRAHAFMHGSLGNWTAFLMRAIDEKQKNDVDSTLH